MGRPRALRLCVWLIALSALGGAVPQGSKRDKYGDFVPLEPMGVDPAQEAQLPPKRKFTPRVWFSSQFRAWFESGGGEIGDGLSIKWSREFGYHFVATKALAVGELLAATPQALQLHAVAHDLGFAGDARSRWTPMQRLAFSLALERVKGWDSRWAPYLALLPDDPAHAVTMRAEERAWVQGTHVGETIEFERRRVDTWVRKALKYAAKCPQLLELSTASISRGQPLYAAITAQLLRWALAVTQQRAHFVNGDGEAFLAPGADLFSHTNNIHTTSMMHLPEDLDQVRR